MQTVFFVSVLLAVVCGLSTRVESIGQLPVGKYAETCHAIGSVGSWIVGISLLVVGFLSFSWWHPIVAFVGCSFVAGGLQIMFPILREFTLFSALALLGATVGLAWLIFG